MSYLRHLSGSDDVIIDPDKFQLNWKNFRRSSSMLYLTKHYPYLLLTKDLAAYLTTTILVYYLT